MDKIFNVEIDGQITLPDGRTLGPLEETTVNVVQPSEGGGGADSVILIKQEGANYVGEIVFGDYTDVSQKIVSHKGANVQIMHDYDDPEYGEYNYCFYTPRTITATTTNGEGGTPYQIHFALDYSEGISFNYVTWQSDGNIVVW